MSPPHRNDGSSVTTLKSDSTSSGNAELSSSPLAFSQGTSLPVLACNPKDGSACVNLQSLGDPCLDDSLDLKVFEYLEQMLASGMTEQRAAEVVRQWSDGGGAGRVDLRKLRGYFLRNTLETVAAQQLPMVAVMWSLTGLSYWSLGQLPGADDALLHPALRGAVVAVNLLLLVHFASGSIKHGGRLVRVGRAALDFSSRAELVLLALEDLANGHGTLISAAWGLPGAAATPTPTSSRRLGGIALAAVQRRAARQRVLDACRTVMQYVKRQAYSTSASNPTATAAIPGDRPSQGAAGTSDSGSGAPVGALSSAGARGVAASSGSQSPPPSPLSSLDSFLVLQTASAAMSGVGRHTADGGEGAGQAGAAGALSPDEMAAAAAMYARFGDSARGGRIGDYELRRLMQDSGAPSLSEDERRLALALHASDRRGEPRLSFGDWAEWWAATPRKS